MLVKLTYAVAGSLAGWVLAIGAAAPADADTSGYINALDSAGLIDEGDGNPCNIVKGLCHGQFPDETAALQTGQWVCKQLAQGRASNALVYDLSHGEGLMPSSYNAPIIVNAAIRYLC
jgi:hypothetical protein